MLDQKTDLIAGEVLADTGAQVGIAVEALGQRTGLRLWFHDLGRGRGPNVILKPSGLKRHSVTLEFGAFSGPVVQQIATADEEAYVLARALLKSVLPRAELRVGSGSLDSWTVADPAFTIDAVRRDVENPMSDEALQATCRLVISPILAAMAELIGYDEVTDEGQGEESGVYEGGILESTIKRRERNPRSRLLCLQLHGRTCTICRVDPEERYGAAGGIIEVHHLVPLSSLDEPRTYDPSTDLIPLCPNCHRAVHRRKPIPYAPAEVAAFMGRDL